jgi:hypothetical protein
MTSNRGRPPRNLSRRLAHRARGRAPANPRRPPYPPWRAAQQREDCPGCVAGLALGQDQRHDSSPSVCPGLRGGRGREQRIRRSSPRIEQQRSRACRPRATATRAATGTTRVGAAALTSRHRRPRSWCRAAGSSRTRCSAECPGVRGSARQRRPESKSACRRHKASADREGSGSDLAHQLGSRSDGRPYRSQSQRRRPTSTTEGCSTSSRKERYAFEGTVGRRHEVSASRSRHSCALTPSRRLARVRRTAPPQRRGPSRSSHGPVVDQTSARSA